jgi:predicted Rossmann-fold nucleotide-binding protein
MKKKYRGSVLGGHDEKKYSPNEIAVVKAIGSSFAQSNIDLYNGGYSGAMRWSSQAHADTNTDSQIWGVGFPTGMVGYDMNGIGNHIRVNNLRQRDLILTKYMDFVFAGYGSGGTKRELNCALEGKWPESSTSELSINWPENKVKKTDINLDDLVTTTNPTATEIDDRVIIVYGIENAVSTIDYLKDSYNKEEILDRLYYIPNSDDKKNETYTYNFHKGIVKELIKCIKKKEILSDYEEEFLDDYRFDNQILYNNNNFNLVRENAIKDLESMRGKKNE